MQMVCKTHESLRQAVELNETASNKKIQDVLNLHGTNQPGIAQLCVEQRLAQRPTDCIANTSHYDGVCSALRAYEVVQSKEA
jgi:hypothetical protein